MEQRALKRLLVLGGATIALAVGVGTWQWRGRRSHPAMREAAAAPRVRIPDGARIRVEVYNTTTTTGLARRASYFLRDQGFDVVHFAGRGPPRDSTLVIDRSGKPEWARLVAEALGGAVVASEPDSSRYLDVTVLLGRSWTPPPQPFYP